MNATKNTDGRSDAKNGKTPPWKKKPAARKAKKKLTAAEVARARERAREAGRRYPNLVDNMWVLRQREK